MATTLSAGEKNITLIVAAVRKVIAGALNSVGVGIAVSTTSFLSIAAATTAKSSLNLSAGGPPTAPNDGDVWLESNTNTGLKVRINGVTKTVTLS